MGFELSGRTFGGSGTLEEARGALRGAFQKELEKKLGPQKQQDLLRPRGFGVSRIGPEATFSQIFVVFSHFWRVMAFCFDRFRFFNDF